MNFASACFDTIYITYLQDSFGGSDNRFEEETPQTYCLRILQKTTGSILLDFMLLMLFYMIQGYSLFGHCCMLVVFVLSLVLIVALMYYMVRSDLTCFFFVPTGAQGVTMFVRLSVRHKFV